MKRYLIYFLSLIALIFTQSGQPYPPIDLISIPTAGTLPKGSYTFENIFTKNGGILPKFSFGITDNFSLGLSFGLQNFIGTGNIHKNKEYPEIQLKYRIFDETETIPAMLFGLDTQGRGEYHEYYLKDYGDGEVQKDINRYEQKALGVYFVISRNWAALGNFGIHAGINKNFTESDDKDTDINLFFGFDKELNKSFSFFAEYNFARDDDGFDDNDELIKREGKGYLNAGIRWSVTDNLMLEINVNDLMKNDQTDVTGDSHNRELKVIYFERF